VQTPNDCGYYQWIDHEATKHKRTLLKDLRDTVWQMKRDEVEHKQLIDQENRKNEEFTQVIIGLERERDELNVK
jgi:demethoxyubiquinone hydroxylase (CLK1/Coq7/Cat5 family)